MTLPPPTGQRFYPPAGHQPFTKPQMELVWGRSGSSPSALPNSLGLEPGRAQVRVRGRGRLTLQPGAGGPLHVLHRPWAALTSWASTQLLLH